MVKFLTYFILVNLTTIGLLQAQSPIIDSIAIGKALSYYKTTIKQQSGLYNGKAYYTFGKKAEGSSLFADSTLVVGNVIYNGYAHQNVPLNYDLYLEKVVSVTGGKLFTLISEKVSEFTINNHRFINLDASTVKGNSFNSGFYDLIYNGSFKILVKRIKNLEFTTNQEKPYLFKAKTTYFLEINQKFVEIDGETSFLDLFTADKNELKKQLEFKNIKFNEDPERAMIVMSTYYDSLKK